VKRILDDLKKTGGALSAIETRWVQQQLKMPPMNISAPWGAALRSWLIGSRVSRLWDWRWSQLCRAGSLPAEGEQQAHLDAFIARFRDIDDLITSLLGQIAANAVF
jgi:hypothetical protein